MEEIKLEQSGDNSVQIARVASGGTVIINTGRRQKLVFIIDGIDEDMSISRKNVRLYQY